MNLVDFKIHITRVLIFFLLFFSILSNVESAAQQKLRVSSNLDYPPYNSVNANGQAEGFAVDLMNAIAKAEGLELEWKVNSWNKGLKLLEKGDIDLLSIMAKSAKRGQSFLFTDSFMQANDAIFVRRGDNLIVSQTDLLNHKVIVARNDFAHEYFRDHFDHDQLIVVETPAEGMTMLATGKARVMVIARLAGLQVLRDLSLDDVEALATPVDWYSRGFSIAVGKHRPDLLVPLNRGLAEVRANGTYNKLFEKWIASADQVAIEHANFVGNLNILLLILAVLIILAMIFIFFLKRMVLAKTTELLEETKKRSQNEERLSTLLYDLTFLQSAINRHAIVSRTDVRGIITYVNDNFCTVSQYSPDELLDNSHDIVKSDFHSKEFYKDLWIVIISGEVWEGEICNRRKDNSLFWVYTTIVPHIGQQGKPDSFLAVRTNITKQKEAESQIRSEREFLNTTLENIKNGIIVLDGKGKVKLVNATARNYFIDLQDILKCKCHTNCLQPCKMQSIIKDALVGNTLDEVPLTFTSINNNERHDFYVSGRPIIDKQGAQVGSLISMQDVTDKLSAEKKMLDSNFRFDAIFDNDAIAIRTSDNSHNILNVNTAFEKMLGYSKVELQKLGLDAITHPDDIEGSHEKYQEFFNGSVDSYRLEKRYIHKNGSIVWGRVSAFRLNNNEDRYLVSMIADITNEKLMEEERKYLQRQLIQVEKMEAIGALTGGIAHDFNNILASIMGYTDLALMKFCPEPESKLKQYLTEVYKAGDRAQNLIAQMMDFSRDGGSSRRNLAMEFTVKETLKMMVPTLPSSVHINYYCDEKDLPQIFIDPVRLQQVVMNLIINARDAIGGKGEISISVKRYHGKPTKCLSCYQVFDGQYVELCVSDLGVGMSPTELELAFTPFYTTKDVGKGTGMGLSVIHGVVHENDGHILVDSGLGRGSDFRILFEIVEPLDVEVEEKDIGVLTMAQATKNVMVVDDELMITAYLNELLTSVGHRVTVYTSSKDALADFNKSPDFFDIVITDQTMPDMIGVELITAMKVVRPEISIILCTGYTDLNVENMLKDFDFIQFLTKPVNRQELLTMVTKAGANE